MLLVACELFPRMFWAIFFKGVCLRGWFGDTVTWKSILGAKNRSIQGKLGIDGMNKFALAGRERSAESSKYWIVGLDGIVSWLMVPVVRFIVSKI